MNWAIDNGLEISWGRGRQIGSFTPRLVHDDSHHFVFTFWTNGSVQVNFADLKRRPPFDRTDTRVDLLRRLNAIAGDRLPENGVDRQPSFFFRDVTDMDGLLATWEWVLDSIRAVPSTAP